MTIKVTINCMGGCWHSKFFALISPKLQLIFISSYTPIAHGRNILFRDKKASVQFAALLEPFCSKLIGNCTEFNPEIFSRTTTRYSLGWHIKICGILCILLSALSIRKVLWNIESSLILQDFLTFCRAKYMALPYNTPEHRRKRHTVTCQ